MERLKIVLYILGLVFKMADLAEKLGGTVWLSKLSVAINDLQKATNDEEQWQATERIAALMRVRKS